MAEPALGSRGLWKATSGPQCTSVQAVYGFASASLCGTGLSRSPSDQLGNGVGGGKLDQFSKVQEANINMYPIWAQSLWLHYLGHSNALDTLVD